MLIRKQIAFCLLIALGLLPFQNCGQSYNSQSDGLYLGNDYGENDCLSSVVNCGASPDYLQVTLDMPNPMMLTNTASTSDDTYIISGRCNTGEYPDYYLEWELRNSAEAVVLTNREVGLCRNGKYQFTTSSLVLNPGEAHTLRIKIIGISTDGASYQNYNANGSSMIDISRAL